MPRHEKVCHRRDNRSKQEGHREWYLKQMDVDEDARSEIGQNQYSGTIPEIGKGTKIEAGIENKIDVENKAQSEVKDRKREKQAQRVAKEDQAYRCPICPGRIFPNPERLKAHMRTPLHRKAAGLETGSPYYCAYGCGVGCLVGGMARVHERTCERRDHRFATRRHMD